MITLYSTGCPTSIQLESALKAKNINYTKISDENEIIAKGFTSVPVLDVDGKIMMFPEAFNKYVRGIK